MFAKILRPGRLALGAVALGAGLFVGAPRAHAVFTICLDDPIIHLSNGGALKVESAVQDDSADVKSITYNVVLPAGVGYKGITVPGPLADITHVNVTTGTGTSYSSAVTIVTGTTSQFGVYMQLKNHQVVGAGYTNGTPVIVSISG